MGRRFARKLLKYRLIDFVASDIHMQRKNCMAKAYKLVLRKCGYSYADEIFNTNAKEIIG
jgi:tyrosine-protein phosphatase YwqE